ncbi:MAG: class I SAM-dependent methyltransferase [Selenomonadaceae bacterium]|nr:class I SAM-dependent methyltransferase [Selenomonadaceae bacterium]MBQ6132012.1 class I SAM-dependent methyltransferase [Selenomonadaceae bacterium]
MKGEVDYLNMQKNFYEAPIPPEAIVGNYAWHEEYPYETFLLFKNGDVRKPIFDTFNDKVALDFACDPGRMFKRMRRLFNRVDGCDISSRLLREAERYCNSSGGYSSKFYLTDGNNLGDAPKNFYDFIYCTISMQHISSHTIRKKILASMFEALKFGGKITLQMAYNPRAPFTNELPESVLVNGMQIRFFFPQRGADYFFDNFDATATNGGHDVLIGKKDLAGIKADLSEHFSNVAIWFSNVSNYLSDLNGKTHPQFWATDWIYLHGEKSSF